MGYILSLVSAICASACSFVQAAVAPRPEVAELGRFIFSDRAISRDGTVSCATCHDPARAFADARAQSIGVEGRQGTRNAPSLIGAGSGTALFWDGRRSRLEDAVSDPFTNPVEFGLPAEDDAVDRLRRDDDAMKRFRNAFPAPAATPTLNQVKEALAAYIRSIPAQTSAFDTTRHHPTNLGSDAERGKELFEGAAGCSECHRIGNDARFSDDAYHHSGIGDATQSEHLAEISRAVVDQNLRLASIGPKVLTDPEWSALGRFVVSHRATEIGAFRTPSLRNVAVTAPYMHDGSIATLSQAVDHEIYYRGFSRDRPLNVTSAERRSIVVFLETLTDEPYAQLGRAYHQK